MGTVLKRLMIDSLLSLLIFTHEGKFFLQVLSTLFFVVVTAAEVLHAINRMSDVQKNPTIAPFLNELTMFKHSIDGYRHVFLPLGPSLKD